MPPIIRNDAPRSAAASISRRASAVSRLARASLSAGPAALARADAIQSAFGAGVRG